MTSNLYVALELVGAILVAQVVAGRLHARLAGEEPTNLQLELITVVAVILYLGAMAALAIVTEIPEPVYSGIDIGVLRANTPSPPA